MDENEVVRCDFDGAVIFVPKNVFVEVVFRMQVNPKKYVRYAEGAKIYSVSERQFFTMAHEAGAVSKPNKMALVSIELMDKYLSECRL